MTTPNPCQGCRWLSVDPDRYGCDAPASTGLCLQRWQCQGHECSSCPCQDCTEVVCSDDSADPRYKRAVKRCAACMGLL